jgi:endonuclease/exonuclease/phosphatase family metal-dependent hydrolase
MPENDIAEARTLKLLTVNTHKGFSAFNRRFMLHDLRDAVREESADLVFMQEVQGSHAGHSARYENWPQQPHYEFLADSIWSEYAYGRNAVYEEGHHGNALMSKFPILKYQNHDVSIWGPEQRGMLHCVLQVPETGQELHAICVHLGLAESHRQQQLIRLCDLVDEVVPEDAPLFVAGDFNDWRQRAHRILLQRAGLKEIFSELQGRSARTFPARVPVLSLDRIYYRNAEALKSQRLSSPPWSRLSDHIALSAEVRL